MAMLPTQSNQTQRKLTEKQQSFLEHLVETQGDAKKAAELAGYTSHYHHVVKTLKNEILELTQEILANSAPKAAFKLVEIMESNRPIVQANNKLSAAQTLLDRVGVSKIDKLDINHNLNRVSLSCLIKPHWIYQRKIMKIFLTEIEEKGKKYAGPNIVAENLAEAEKAAKANNLIVVGEFVELVVGSGLMHYLEEEIHNKDRVLH